MPNDIKDFKADGTRQAEKNRSLAELQARQITVAEGVRRAQRMRANVDTVGAVRFGSAAGAICLFVFSAVAVAGREMPSSMKMLITGPVLVLLLIVYCANRENRRNADQDLTAACAEQKEIEESLSAVHKELESQKNSVVDESSKQRDGVTVRTLTSSRASSGSPVIRPQGPPAAIAAASSTAVSPSTSSVVPSAPLKPHQS